MYATMCAKLLQSCPTLCDPVDCSPQGSPVHGIFRARVLERVAMPSPEDLPNPGTEPASLTSPALTGRFLTTSTTWKAPLVREIKGKGRRQHPETSLWEVPLWT